jgi:hypothetical protein
MLASGNKKKNFVNEGLARWDHSTKVKRGRGDPPLESPATYVLL